MWAACQTNVRFEAAAPMAGPYDLTGVTLDNLLKPTAQPATYAARLYLIAFIGYSASRLFGIDLKDYFTPSFASYIPVVFEQELTDLARIKKLAAKGVQVGAIGSVKKALSGRFRRVVKDRDLSDPLMALLDKEDLWDSVVTCRTLFVCLYPDELVPWGNTYRTVSNLWRVGLQKEYVNYLVIRDKLNHVTAAAPSIALARRYFLGKGN
ncbi:MAG: hypothetical protein H0W86_03175 [Armatimonadetes bacterium]|nr:hypothetical protein [Armatimonadota bacterium]